MNIGSALRNVELLNSFFVNYSLSRSLLISEFDHISVDRSSHVKFPRSAPAPALLASSAELAALASIVHRWPFVP